MKKIILLFIGLLALTLNSQTVVWSDDFNDEDISDWTLIDSDGDTLNWGDTFTVGPSGEPPVTPVSLISRSWQDSALTPDNWAVSPAINLSGASGTITVDWITQVVDESWDEEKYSIHVGTSDNISVLMYTATSFTETLGDDINTGTPTPASLDISSLAGEPLVYIAFRHWDCTNQDFISIDDLVVNAAVVLNVDEFDKSTITHHYNKDSKTLNLQSSDLPISGIEIYSILGQNVISKSLNNTNESLNVSSLNDGIYVAKININGNSKTIKFIKS